MKAVPILTTPSTTVPRTVTVRRPRAVLLEMDTPQDLVKSGLLSERFEDRMDLRVAQPPVVCGTRFLEQCISAILLTERDPDQSASRRGHISVPRALLQLLD